MPRLTADSLIAEYRADRHQLYWRRDTSRRVARRIAGRIPRIGYEMIAEKRVIDGATFTLWLQNISGAVYRFRIQYDGGY